MAQANEELVRQNAATLERSERIAAANEALAAAYEEQVEITRGLERAALRQADRGDAEAVQQERERRRRNTAKFDLVPDQFSHLGINLRLPCRGPHIAEAVSAVVMHEDRQVGDSTQHRQLEPNESVRVAMRSAFLGRFISGEDPNRAFAVVLSYDDGNGHHDKVWNIRFTGGNPLHDWRLEIVDEPEF
jgi:hypothetical protein